MLLWRNSISRGNHLPNSIGPQLFMYLRVIVSFHTQTSVEFNALQTTSPKNDQIRQGGTSTLPSSPSSTQPTECHIYIPCEPPLNLTSVAPVEAASAPQKRALEIHVEGLLVASTLRASRLHATITLLEEVVALSTVLRHTLHEHITARRGQVRCLEDREHEQGVNSTSMLSGRTIRASMV